MTELEKPTPSRSWFERLFDRFLLATLVAFVAFGLFQPGDVSIWSRLFDGVLLWLLTICLIGGAIVWPLILVFGWLFVDTTDRKRHTNGRFGRSWDFDDGDCGGGDGGGA